MEKKNRVILIFIYIAFLGPNTTQILGCVCDQPYSCFAVTKSSSSLFFNHVFSCGTLLAFRKPSSRTTHTPYLHAVFPSLLSFLGRIPQVTPGAKRARATGARGGNLSNESKKCSRYSPQRRWLCYLRRPQRGSQPPCLCSEGLRAPNAPPGPPFIPAKLFLKRLEFNQTLTLCARSF